MTIAVSRPKNLRETLSKAKLALEKGLNISDINNTILTTRNMAKNQNQNLPHK
jgi:hypothetical protein